MTTTKKSTTGVRLDPLDFLVLHQDVREQRLLKRYHFVIGERDIHHPDSDRVIMLNDFSSHSLVPCCDGVLILSDQSIAFMRESTWNPNIGETLDYQEDILRELSGARVLTW